MKTTILIFLLLINISSSLFAEMRIDFAAGYRHQEMYDRVYSPIIYEWNGFDIGLGFHKEGELIRNRVSLNFYYLPAEFSNQKYPEGFDVKNHREVDENYNELSGWYKSSCYGGKLAYAMDFTLNNCNDKLFIYLGPQFLYNINMVGLETYCMDYSLEITSGLKYILKNSHELRLNLSASVLSFINRPAYNMFDNQIMESYEKNWMKELVHVDKVTNIFSGEYYTFDMPVYYVIPLSASWEAFLGYKAYFQYCSFPEKLIHIDHSIVTGTSLKF